MTAHLKEVCMTGLFLSSKQEFQLLQFLKFTISRYLNIMNFTIFEAVIFIVILLACTDNINIHFF